MLQLMRTESPCADSSIQRTVGLYIGHSKASWLMAWRGQSRAEERGAVQVDCRFDGLAEPIWITAFHGMTLLLPPNIDLFQHPKRGAPSCRPRSVTLSQFRSSKFKDVSPSCASHSG